MATLSWESFDGEELGTTVSRTHEAILKSKEYSANTSPIEKALIDALYFRYPHGKPIQDCSAWNRDYAKAMSNVFNAFPTNLDIAAIYADSLMNQAPWQLWDIKTGEPTPNASTLKVKQILETALAQEGGLEHCGLINLYVHLLEMSPRLEEALPVADHLRNLVPHAGHLRHMPSHLDVLCGDYTRAISSNLDAIRADEKFVAKRGALNFYTLVILL